MRCRSRILLKEARKKGSGEPFEKVSASWSASLQGVKIPEGTVECGGVVKVTVETDYGGSCACSGGSPRAEYKCQRCGNTSFPEFPDTADALSTFLTKMLDRMSAQEYDAVLDDYQRAQDEHKAMWEKMRKKVGGK